MTEGPLRDNRPVLQWVLFGKPITPARAGGLIAATSLLLTLCGGTATWLLDKDGIDGIGDSFWWALQTVTTVGYGDVVPEGATGRIVGAILMLNGIALISVVTAVVTAMLVDQARRRRGEGAEAEIAAALERIEARLDQIESRIGSPGGQP
ncbi:MAG TPA: potassium channel family protein [Solirubrobacterales bacterium]